jgi:hypothetical protein
VAVAFDAVGPAGGGGAKSTATPLTWLHINSAAGNAFLAGFNYRTGTTSDVTAVTYGGVALSRLGQVPGNNVGPGGMDLWGKIGGLPTGSNTVSVTFGTATADLVTGGSISLTGAVSFGTAVTGFASATSISVNVTGTTTGGMIVAAASFGNSAAVFATTSPGTQRWAVTGDSNEAADNTTAGTWPSPGGTQATGFSVTVSPADFWGLVAVEVKGAATAPTSPVALLPLIPPGWFPGSAAVIQDPGGIPFYAEPAPTDAAPAVIVPPTPEAAGLAEPLPLPPGWFPGSERVTAVPGGMPFTQLPPPLTPPPAVIFPVPETAGIVDYLPLPPGYFPGSQAVAVDPGGIPFYSQPLPLTPPPAPLGRPVITSLAGGGNGWFTDQYGQPRLVWGDAAWGLPGGVGRWSSGAWRADYDAYFATRSGQGCTVVYLAPMTTVHNGGLNDDGRQYDGTLPFQGGSLANPSTGLTAAYWARIDYMLASAAAQGITVVMNAIGYNSDFETNGPLAGKSTTEFQAFGAALGGRYATASNLVWTLADDYFGDNDAVITAFLTGVRGAGDTHPVSIENFSETTSRKQLPGAGAALPWGAANAQYNFVYSYDVIYIGTEDAYTADGTVPVIAGDGYFYQGGTSYSATFDRAFRQESWWALSSGARGKIHGDEGIWQWPSTAQAHAASAWWWANNSANIVAAFTALAGWHLLIPDTGSALVTAGRGTRKTFTGTQYEPAVTDAYVTASKTPDGSLAVVYLSHGSTITIDQSKLGSGYTATWIDPVSGATSSATAGTTYNSTAKGSNSAGDPDWVLVFQGPAAAAASAPAPVVVAPSAAVMQAANW